jgi:pyruvate dehydrogenase E1 component alpha subunit
MVSAMGMPAVQGDGNNASSVYEAVAKGIEAIRAGEGPRFFEFATYRWREHCGPLFDNDLGYRTEAEFLEWKAKEPIGRFERDLLAEGTLSATDVGQMQGEIAREVREAFDFAESSPFPPAEDAFTDVYAQGAA